MNRLLHYEIAEKLGEGKHGATYLAMDTGFQRAVAIKLLDHPHTKTDEWKLDFQSRMARFETIDDVRLARFYSLEEAEGQRFIVREYIEGRTVAEVVQTNPIEHAQILEISLELTTLLKNVHDHGLVHGNLSPTNILINLRGRVRLCDPGLGLPDEAWAGFPRNSYGDMVYMAPELFTGGEPTVGTDHYSLGALLYLMWTGQPLFPDDDPNRLALTIRREPVSFEVRPARDIPGVARLLIDKLLAKDPDERFVSTEELLFTLQGIMSLGVEPTVLVSRKKWSPTPRQYLLISVLVLLLVILWLVVTMTNR